MISVIISVYNVSPYIERCINSILSQTYSDLEVIAVDDGLIDDSGSICERLAKEDPRIVVVHKLNGGNASARNAGVDVAHGEFITFVDADDYIEKDMYEVMLAEMSDPSVSIVNCGIIVTEVTGKDKVVKSNEKMVLTREEALFDFFTRKGNVSPAAWNKLYRRNLFDKGVRFNNDVIHEDTEAMPRFLDAAEKIVVIDKAFYHYIKRNNSASTSKKFSLRGYHILDSMKDYERMCRTNYLSMLPCLHHYELVTTYEMLLNWAGCVDHKRYLVQGISLKFKIVKALIKCMRWKSVRSEHADEMKDILLNTILGVRLIR